MIMIGDRKKAVSAILGPEGGEKSKEDAPADALEMISEELIAAVQSKDAGAVASALRAAFEEFGSQEDPGED